jgi:hypothetical protein
VPRQDLAKQRHGPLLQRLGQQGLVWSWPKGSVLRLSIREGHL